MSSVMVFDPTEMHPCHTVLPEAPTQDSVWRCSCGAFWQYVMGHSGALVWRKIAEEEAVQFIQRYVGTRGEAQHVILDAINRARDAAAELTKAEEAGGPAR